MRRLWAAGMILAAASGTAGAAPVDTEAYRMRSFQDLVAVCGAEEVEAAQFCRGWLVGNGSLYASLVEAQAIKPWACAQPVPSLDEIRRAIVAYGRSNPQTGSQTAVDGFWRAAASIWPCDPRPLHEGTGP
ncbi:Rap1a/Tai family immunity protein [Geminicoccus roseus]|uniref:Rap1a/Tai family immunity protein n=1 Tax=Geminicoccus roseus TaxID=404900 RepID=UPI0012F927CF|nr:Rap1a/Tai family immunity protein [Geminicoccus roseus]